MKELVELLSTATTVAEYNKLRSEGKKLLPHDDEGRMTEEGVSQLAQVDGSGMIKGVLKHGAKYTTVPCELSPMDFIREV